MINSIVDKFADAICRFLDPCFIKFAYLTYTCVSKGAPSDEAARSEHCNSMLKNLGSDMHKLKPVAVLCLPFET